jgi:transglutaminase-like putative cysteine protease
MALLFITLCRCSGIPAGWQSGLITRPDFCGAHDWATFYIAPFGWLYADPSFGTGAVRQKNEERRLFYFGNLDPFRMVANTQFQTDFTNPKDFWRADPYDNQSGEIETLHHGLPYFEFDSFREVIEFEEL